MNCAVSDWSTYIPVSSTISHCCSPSPRSGGCLWKRLVMTKSPVPYYISPKRHINLLKQLSVWAQFFFWAISGISITADVSGWEGWNALILAVGSKCLNVMLSIPCVFCQTAVSQGRHIQCILITEDKEIISQSKGSSILTVTSLSS